MQFTDTMSLICLIILIFRKTYLYYYILYDRIYLFILQQLGRDSRHFFHSHGPKLLIASKRSIPCRVGPRIRLVAKMVSGQSLRVLDLQAPEPVAGQCSPRPCRPPKAT